ncbi:MAG: YdcF family protein [Lachnospiraceae bacterium]|jgi:uncharacterized SAM-binding protein YcdF (DUF218 family)|nr:YdcF family protein [Lachnospiraceae bacterium]
MSKLRKVGIVLCIIFAGLLILYTVIQVVMFPTNLGSYLAGIIGVMLLIYAWLCNSQKAKKGFWKFLKVIFHMGVFVFLTTFIVFFMTILKDGRNVPEKGKDAVIVLGAGLKGEKVSLTLAGRLDKAIEYHLKSPTTVIVVSGGQGTDEIMPEADAMKEYLIEHDISEGAIVCEDESTSTQENFRFSKKILDEVFWGDYTTVFVTNEFHAWRAKRLAKEEGLESEALPCASPYYMLPSYYLREYLIFLKDLII